MRKPKFARSVTFREKIIALRNKMGINQTAMGSLLGVSRNYVSMMESDESPREPSKSVKLLLSQLWDQEMNETPIESEYSESAVVREAEAPYGRGRAALKKARLARGMSMADLCKTVGYSQLVYSQIEDGSSQMSRKMAERVASVLGIDVEDLLDGSDEPPANGTHHGTVGETPNIDLPPGQKARFVPLLSMAQCGRMMAYDDTAYTHDGFVAFNPDPQAFAVTLSGDSMTPVIQPGDVAIIYPRREPRNGGLVIAKLDDDHGGDVMLKLYQSSASKITLSSYNPAYPPMSFERSSFRWIYPVASITKVYV